MRRRSAATPTGDGVSSPATVPPVRQAQPPVVGPAHLLQCGLAAERGPVVRSDRACAQVGHVPLALRGAHQGAVTGLLELGVRVEPVELEVVRVAAARDARGVARQERVERVRFVGSLDRGGPRQRDPVRVPGASLGRHQVVPVVVPVEVRGLQAPTVRAAPVDPARLPDQGTPRRVVLVQDDGARVLVAVAGVPLQRDQPVPAVGVVEERRVEADAVQVRRRAPGPLDARRGHQVVVDVEVACGRAAHHRVGQVERAGGSVDAQVGRPDALVARQATQVVGAGRQGVPDELPPLQVA